MRRALLAGNWKMFKTAQEAKAMVKDLAKAVSGCRDRDIVVCPPYTALQAVAEAIKGTPIALGAQNIHWEAQGAFTGEISGPMLKEAGVSFAIIGHSERRQYFGETNDTVNKRMKAAFRYELVPIVCVGETLKEREQGQTEAVVTKQIQESLAGLASESQASHLVIAYEPVWAIGTGRTATPEQAEEVHRLIRSLLEKMGSPLAAAVRILYGGSIKPENIQELMQKPNIDGGLVGGASLEAASFAKIVCYDKKEVLQ